MLSYSSLRDLLNVFEIDPQCTVITLAHLKKAKTIYLSHHPDKLKKNSQFVEYRKAYNLLQEMYNNQIKYIDDKSAELLENNLSNYLNEENNVTIDKTIENFENDSFNEKFLTQTKKIIDIDDKAWFTGDNVSTKNYSSNEVILKQAYNPNDYTQEEVALDVKSSTFHNIFNKLRRNNKPEECTTITLNGMKDFSPTTIEDAYRDNILLTYEVFEDASNEVMKKRMEDHSNATFTSSPGDFDKNSIKFKLMEDIFTHYTDHNDGKEMTNYLLG